MNAEENQVTYLKWLAVAHPDIYRDVMQQLTLAEPLGDLGELGWINLVIQAVGIAAGAAMQKKQIDKQAGLAKKQLATEAAQMAADRDQAAKLALLEVNTKRAQAGLPPVDITGKVIGAATLPTPSALVPYAGGPTASTLIPGVPNYVTYGGAALALVAVVMMMRRR